jgi:hypothetical protein
VGHGRARRQGCGAHQEEDAGDEEGGKASGKAKEGHNVEAAGAAFLCRRVQLELPAAAEIKAAARRIAKAALPPRETSPAPAPPRRRCALTRTPTPQHRRTVGSADR